MVPRVQSETLGPHYPFRPVLDTDWHDPEQCSGVQQGYAQVRRTAGANPFITYAVINDGAGPGERTGDGAYIGSSE